MKKDTVNILYTNQIHHFNRKCLRECIGETYTLMGFIHKEYDDGVRVLLVTDEGILIRIPKWYSSMFLECDDTELEMFKSGKLIITNIRKSEINPENGYFTYKFDLVEKKYMDEKEGAVNV